VETAYASLHRLELDAELERQTADLAQASGVSAADLIREAIKEYAATRENGEPNDDETLFDWLRCRL